MLLSKFWFEKKLQSQITDNEAKLKSIQTELDKGRHVHRIQFEKEFKIYEEIWSVLFDLQKYISLVEGRKNEESYEDTKKVLNKKHNELINLFEKNKPFYSENVYESLMKILRFSVKNALKRNEDVEHCFENHEELDLEINNCLKMVRTRIGSMYVAN